MEFSELKELMSLFEASSIREFDLKNDQFKLYLSKNEQAVKQAPSVSEQAPTSPPTEGATTAGQAPSPTVKAVEGTTVDSPIVGVVYLSGSPGEAPFKAVGETVTVGETLCIVEAMKIMNEIVSDVAGTITEILIENEDVVEYGQPLFRIV